MHKWFHAQLEEKIIDGICHTIPHSFTNVTGTHKTLFYFTKNTNAHDRSNIKKRPDQFTSFKMVKFHTYEASKNYQVSTIVGQFHSSQLYVTATHKHCYILNDTNYFLVTLNIQLRVQFQFYIISLNKRNVESYTLGMAIPRRISFLEESRSRGMANLHSSGIEEDEIYSSGSSGNFEE